MKKLLLSLLLLAAAGQIFAQRNNEIKLRLNEPKQQYIGDISVGYGCISIIDKDLANLINIGYAIYLSPNFSLGGTFSWSALKSTLNADDSFSVLLNAKYNWFNKRYVSLYSRIGAGLNVYNSFSSYNNSLSISRHYNYALQLTLIGVEAGKGCLRFYSELGAGNTGCFEFGIRLKL